MNAIAFIRSNYRGTGLKAPTIKGVRPTVKRGGLQCGNCQCQCDCIGAPGNCSPGG